MAQHEDDELKAVERQLNANIRALMKSRKMRQAEFAEKLGRSQPWVSKRMSGSPKGNKWKVEDLEDLQAVFDLSAWELLRPGHGQFERRHVSERRVLLDRREPQLQGGFRGASSRLKATSTATEHVIEAANFIYDLAERLHDLANAIIGRHATDIGDSSASRPQDAPRLGGETRGPGSEKAG